VSVYERDRALLEYCDGLGIRPGARFQVLNRNYDATLTLAHGSRQVHLGHAAAERIWVDQVG